MFGDFQVGEPIHFERRDVLHIFRKKVYQATKFIDQYYFEVGRGIGVRDLGHTVLRASWKLLQGRLTHGLPFLPTVVS
jgi:hypothetical protein